MLAGADTLLMVPDSLLPVIRVTLCSVSGGEVGSSTSWSKESSAPHTSRKALTDPRPLSSRAEQLDSHVGNPV